MFLSLKRKILAGTVAALALAGAGGAIAATQLGSPQATSQAIVDDAAQQLGISSSKLNSALETALENQVDAAVKDGRLTQSEADAIKSRIESGDFPIFFGVGRHERVGPGAGLGAAASYLGLTGAELRTQLESGKTLAAVAKAQGKSVDGLVQAMYDAAKQRLDQDVASGRLTAAQEQSILTDLKQRITDLVNGTAPRAGVAFGPPPVAAPTA